jgi:hypothetical protein
MFLQINNSRGQCAAPAASRANTAQFEANFPRYIAPDFLQYLSEDPIRDAKNKKGKLVI